VSLGDKVREIDLTPGEECADAAPLPVDAPAAEAAGVTVSEGGLPVTGSSVTVLIGLGAALVASGLFFALVSRRRSLGLHSS
jgi:LPXTG-motif cell wall-anchored protein